MYLVNKYKGRFSIDKGVSEGVESRSVEVERLTSSWSNRQEEVIRDREFGV